MKLTYLEYKFDGWSKMSSVLFPCNLMIDLIVRSMQIRSMQIFLFVCRQRKSLIESGYKDHPFSDGISLIHLSSKISVLASNCSLVRAIIYRGIFIESLSTKAIYTHVCNDPNVSHGLGNSWSLIIMYLRTWEDWWVIEVVFAEGTRREWSLILHYRHLAG